VGNADWPAKTLKSKQRKELTKGGIWVRKIGKLESVRVQRLRQCLGEKNYIYLVFS